MALSHTVMLLRSSDTGLSKIAVLLLAKNLYIICDDVNETFCEDQDFWLKIDISAIPVYIQCFRAIGWMTRMSSGCKNHTAAIQYVSLKIFGKDEH